MISLINPEDQFSSPHDTQTMAAAIHKAHMQFTEARLMDALIARFGELPSDDEIAAHCMKVIDHENVSHYLWLDAKPGVGEHVDLSNALCSIAPPKFNLNLEN